MSSRLLYLLWLLSFLLVVIRSLLPPSSPVMRAVGRLPVSQKVLHFCAYTWLALLGVALELGQKLVPGRAFEIRDMFINGVGVLTGIAIGILSRRIVPAVSS